MATISTKQLIRQVATLGLLSLAFVVHTAQAQSVSLAGVMGKRALLVVDGSKPKLVGVGQRHLGVKVLSVSGHRATVESDAGRQVITLGGAPVALTGATDSGGGNTQRIVLRQTGGGHFMTGGAINGKSVRFMVDTGATTIAMDESTAKRIGLKYKGGRKLSITTANGVVAGWRVKLDSVKLGSVTVYNVDAGVSQVSMPYVLLGNSFLDRFVMTRDDDKMVLEKRY